MTLSKQKSCFAPGYHMAVAPAWRPGGLDSTASRGCYATCCPFCSVLFSPASLKLWQALAKSNRMTSLQEKKNAQHSLQHHTTLAQTVREQEREWGKGMSWRGGERKRENEEEFPSMLSGLCMLLGLCAAVLKWNRSSDLRLWTEQLLNHGTHAKTMAANYWWIDV